MIPQKHSGAPPLRLREVSFMVVTVRSLGLNGVSGYEVSAECFLSGGLPAFDVVGPVSYTHLTLPTKRT